MNIQIKATKIDLTPEIKEYIQKKMDMLEKYLGNIIPLNCDFEIEHTTTHHVKGKFYRAECNLNLKGELLRVAKAEEELRKAIDKVKDHMAEAIKKYKGKINNR